MSICCKAKLSQSFMKAVLRVMRRKLGWHRWKRHFSDSAKRAYEIIAFRLPFAMTLALVAKSSTMFLIHETPPDRAVLAQWSDACKLYVHQTLTRKG